MQEAGINLRKIKGGASVDVKINIPLKADSSLIYDINADLPNVSLNAFDNKAELSQANLKGNFDGSRVKIYGPGRVNDFKSDLSFVYNLKDNKAFDYQFKLNSIFGGSKKSKKVAFVNLIKGKSDIDLTYTGKNSIGLLDVKSDLTNLELYFDKLGIRKKKGVKSNFLLKGAFSGKRDNKLSFTVKSADKLRVKGDVFIKKNITVLNIHKLKNKRTYLKAKITIAPDDFSAYLYGKSLDLSSVDTINLLQKEKDAGSTNTHLKVNKVYLKQGVSVDNLDLFLRCKNSVCYDGNVWGRIQGKNLSLDLIKHPSYEEWVIKCDNAGQLLKGLDIYNTMKNGSLLLNIKANRRQVKSGEIIPIHNGKFTLKDFTLSDSSPAMRIVSLVSLPGLLNTLRGNKNIFFYSMDGNFSFENKLLRVSNTIGKGSSFDFYISGDINTNSKQLNLKGHVTPKIYGVSTVIQSVPVVGGLFRGNKKRQGLISKSFKLKSKY